MNVRCFYVVQKQKRVADAMIKALNHTSKLLCMWAGVIQVAQPWHKWPSKFREHAVVPARVLPVATASTLRLLCQHWGERWKARHHEDLFLKCCSNEAKEPLRAA